MKKILALMLTLCVLLGLSTFASAEETKGEGVMTYAEYAAADLDTEVVVETYVQAKQSWWDNKATVYTQDQDGAYFLYNMACSEEDYAKLVPGTKIKVTGYKSAWSGEVEITDATFEIEEGSFIAEPLDITDKLASEELINYQNLLVSFKGMTVEASNDEGAAFLSTAGTAPVHTTATATCTSRCPRTARPTPSPWRATCAITPPTSMPQWKTSRSAT